MAEENLSVGSASKPEVIKKFRIHDKDSGSPEVQIALLTSRLENLSRHLEKNDQDKHSRKGLLGIVSKRKRLLSYLKNENVDRYRKTIESLGLRK
jgi:small subunit ribosomal protein S15